MQKDMPLIAAAFVCERVLKEDGVFSAIRIVDTYTQKVVRVSMLSAEQPAPRDSQVSPDKVMNVDHTLDMSALVMVRAGELRGEHEMRVEVSGPDGKTIKYPTPFKINFAKDDPAEAAAMQIRFVLAGNSPPGRYWINVFWNGEPLTKIPVKLVKESGSLAPEGDVERSR